MRSTAGHGRSSRDHVHPDHDRADDAPDQNEADNTDGPDFWYYLDNIELHSVGIDIGSSTSHLIFSRTLLHREAQSLSSRFVVVEQDTIWRSEVRLTPYLPDGLIDTDELSRFVRHSRDESGLTRDQIDTGVVILTGEALRRVNARRIASALAEQAGDFVSISAGHHLEATLAAYGSGAVGLSQRRPDPVLLVDVGGGTTKFALVEQGTVVATGAIEIGGRLLAWTEDRVLTWVSPSLTTFAEQAGHLVAGQRLRPADERALVDEMVRRILAVCHGEVAELDPAMVLADNGLSGVARAGCVACSGGVSEYIYGREPQGYGDLGATLGARLRAGFERTSTPVVEPGLGIRATVVGASQSSAQVSGNTVLVTGTALPVRNLPVLHPPVRLAAEVDPAQLSDAIATELRLRALAVADPFALALSWRGPPSYARLAALADGILDAVRGRPADAGPIAIVLDADLAATLGRVLAERSPEPVPVICLDNISLQKFDFLDIGPKREPAGVYPVMIKSLLFGPAVPDRAGLAEHAARTVQSGRKP